MDKRIMQKTVIKRFGVAIPDYTCWMVRKLMKYVVEGRHNEGYKVLPECMKVFKNSSVKRYQICIGSAIRAFK